jgi:hypothetical protein
MQTLDFDAVDRCFSKIAAAAFVGLIAVVVWVWPMIHMSPGFSHQRAGQRHASTAFSLLVTGIAPASACPAGTHPVCSYNGGAHSNCECVS